MNRIVFEQAGWTTAQQDCIRVECIDRLGLCGCGSPEETYEIVMMLLVRAEAKASFYEECEDAAGRWVEFGAKVLDAANLLEHGSGMGWPWLTDSGREFLRFLREFGTNPDTWPEWATAEVYE